MDSGQVTGLEDEEIAETLLIIFFMASTLKKTNVSLNKVRIGHQGFSCMIKVVKIDVSSNKNFTNELMDI